MTLDRTCLLLVVVMTWPAPAVASDEQAPVVEFESDSEVDWSPYATEMKALVRSHWEVPRAAQRGRKGAVELHFFITIEGAVEDVQLVRRFGPRSLVASSRAAIVAGSPYPPLPAEAEERAGVTWCFYYNLDEVDLGRWAKRRARARR